MHINLLLTYLSLVLISCGKTLMPPTAVSRLDSSRITEINQKSGESGDQCVKKHEALYDADISYFIESSNCSVCHNAEGAAGKTRFLVDGSIDHGEMDFLVKLVDKDSPHKSEFLLKLSGEKPHTGGVLAPKGGEHYNSLLNFAKKVSEYQKCLEITKAGKVQQKDLHSFTLSPQDLLKEIPSLDNCGSDDPLEARVWRLTQAQYTNSIVSVFGSAAAALVADLQDHNPMLYMSNDLSQLNFNSIQMTRAITASQKLSEYAINSVSDIKSCATSWQNTCITTIVTKYGASFWRRPLTNAEISGIVNGATVLVSKTGGRPNAVRAAIEIILMSPHFWYRSEIGVPFGNGINKLKPHEVASLLSYTMWDAPPDGTLLAEANAGRLQDQTSIKNQIARMKADVRAKNFSSRFFNEWLKAKNVLGTPKTGDAATALTAEIRQDMKTSFEMTVADATKDGTVKSLFQTNQFFLNQRLATFLGLSRTDIGTTFVKVALEPSQRAGILSHPAYLTSHASAQGTALVHRGVFLLSTALCSPLPPPPADIPSLDSSLVGVDLTKLTTRQTFEKVHSGQPACAACHSRIDPAGGAFEQYDTLGRFRTTERSLPIDSSGSFSGLGDINLRYANGVEMFNGIASSSLLAQCVTKQMFSYAYGTQARNQHACEVARVHTPFQKSDYKLQVGVDALLDTKSVLYRRTR